MDPTELDNLISASKVKPLTLEDTRLPSGYYVGEYEKNDAGYMKLRVNTAKSTEFSGLGAVKHGISGACV